MVFFDVLVNFVPCFAVVSFCFFCVVGYFCLSFYGAVKLFELLKALYKFPNSYVLLLWLVQCGPGVLLVTVVISMHSLGPH